ncbi:hypothetical protein D3C75_1064130 [compost metagenome]
MAGAEIELELALLIIGAPVVFLGQCQVQRAMGPDVLEHRGLQQAASTSAITLVGAALAHRFAEIAITLGGVAITGEAQVGPGFE